MKLIKLSYGEFSNTKKAWEYESFDVSTINLIVGKNASGKSRVLSSIKGFSKLFINQIAPFSNGTYNAELEHDSKLFKYTIEIQKNTILHEKLEIDNTLYLERDYEGIGKIMGEETKDFIKFKIPQNQLGVSRSDEIQHPSLIALQNWGNDLKYLKFARDIEKESIAVPNPNKVERKDTSDSVAIDIFQQGEKKFGPQFVDAVISDMNKVGYSLESIKFGKMDIKITTPFPAVLSGLLIKENDCNTEINQLHMSDGMFRALASLIHFNYYSLSGTCGLVLIDNIGEGLDFDRSSKLIKILVAKAEKTNIQLIMSTNDKFVMNSVPLKYWQILNRTGSYIKIYNIQNSQTIFEDFKFTGLNNFNFFSGDFINESMEIQN